MQRYVFVTRSATITPWPFAGASGPSLCLAHVQRAPPDSGFQAGHFRLLMLCKLPLPLQSAWPKCTVPLQMAIVFDFGKSSQPCFHFSWSSIFGKASFVLSPLLCGLCTGGKPTMERFLAIQQVSNTGLLMGVPISLLRAGRKLVRCFFELLRHTRKVDRFRALPLSDFLGAYFSPLCRSGRISWGHSNVSVKDAC